MGAVEIRVDFAGLSQFEGMLREAGLKAPYAVAKALDAVGNKAMTQVKRAVAKQAGVSVGRAGSIMSRTQAMGAGQGTYTIIARDVTMSLKEFAPRATRRGVSAAPWGHRRVFPHTFFGPGGHVYSNTRQWNKNSKRFNAIEKKWGPAIPKEMVKDLTEQTFYAYTAQALPAELEKWLFRALG